MKTDNREPLRVNSVVAKIFCDIAAAGEQVKSASKSYEEIFSSFRRDLRSALEMAQSSVDAAALTLALTDAAAEALRTYIPLSDGRACHSGCSACCHLYVGVDPGIAALVADHLRSTLGADELQQLLKRLEAAHATILSLPDPVLARIPCPLLGKDGLCSIYDVRPLSCRAFTSADARACHAFVFGPEDATGGVVQSTGHFRLYQEASAALSGFARARAIAPGPKGFVEAMLAEIVSRQNGETG